MSSPSPPDQGINIQSPPYNLPISLVFIKISTYLVPSPLLFTFLIYTLADLSAVHFISFFHHNDSRFSFGRCHSLFYYIYIFILNRNYFFFIYPQHHVSMVKWYQNESKWHTLRSVRDYYYPY